MNNEVEKILEYEKYKERMQKIYPNVSEEKREQFFHYRVDYWKMLLDNFDRYFEKK